MDQELIIYLPPALKRYIESKLESGEYTSESDYIKYLVRRERMLDKHIGH